MKEVVATYTFSPTEYQNIGGKIFAAVTCALRKRWVYLSFAMKSCDEVSKITTMDFELWTKHLTCTYFFSERPKMPGLAKECCIDRDYC